MLLPATRKIANIAPMEYYQKINTVSLFALTLMASAVMLAVTKTVMIPFVLSVFLYLILNETMKFFAKFLRLPRWVSLALTLALFCVFSLLVALLVVGSIESFISGIDQYRDRVSLLIASIEEKLAQFGYQMPKLGLLQKDQISSFLPTLRKLTSTMIGLISNSVLIVIFTLFLLTGETIHNEKNPTIIKIKNGIAKYVSTKLVVSVATGAISYLIFLIFQIELASMFAVLTVFLNFIPSIGSIFAVLLPLPVIILQYYFGWQLFAVLGLLTFFQMLIGNFLEPKIMGKSMGIHPVAIILSLTFWGFIWGLPGMFLSVPIMATLKIIFESFEFTTPIAELMGGKLG